MSSEISYASDRETFMARYHQNHPGNVNEQVRENELKASATFNSYARDQLHKLGHADISINQGVADEAILSAKAYEQCEDVTNLVGDAFTLGAHRNLQSAYACIEKGDGLGAAKELGIAGVRIGGSAVITALGGLVGKKAANGGATLLGAAGRAASPVLSKAAPTVTRITKGMPKTSAAAGALAKVGLRLLPAMKGGTHYVTQNVINHELSDRLGTPLAPQNTKTELPKTQVATSWASTLLTSANMPNLLKYLKK